MILRLSHRALDQLEVFLLCPNGLRVQLIGALDGANLTDTTLDDEAATSITEGSAP